MMGNNADDSGRRYLRNVGYALDFVPGLRKREER